MAFEEHTVEDFLKHDRRALEKKRLFANMCIMAAKEAIRDGDERGQAALEYYRGERERINLARQHKVYGDDGPPDQVIGMKAAAVSDDSKEMRKAGAMSQKEVRRKLRGLVDDGMLEKADVPKLMALFFPVKKIEESKDG